MHLNWGRSSDAEDRFEKWIAQQHERRVLAGETHPPGPHPAEAFLEDLAHKSKKILLSDPRVDHAATCPDCMSRLLVLRKEYRARRGSRILTRAAIATCVVIVLGLIFWKFGTNRIPLSNTARVAETVNLFDTGVLRGEEPRQLQSVFLPAALIDLTIILPRHSTPGRYLVAITRDQDGSGVVAEGRGDTVSNGSEWKITTSIDLRGAKVGQYFLSTTHEQDQAAYYYPLQIR